MAEGISAPEVQPKLAAGTENFILLDVREAEELARSSLDGITHIPMNSIPERISELNPAHEIVVMCHFGQRSNMVADYLLENGFSNVKNLVGGIDAWSVQVNPEVPRYQ